MCTFPCTLRYRHTIFRNRKLTLTRKIEYEENTVHSNIMHTSQLALPRMCVTYAHVGIMSKYFKIFPRLKIPTETRVKSISTLGCRLFASATSQRRISTGETALNPHQKTRHRPRHKNLRINNKLNQPRSLLSGALFTPAKRNSRKANKRLANTYHISLQTSSYYRLFHLAEQFLTLVKSAEVTLEGYEPP